MHLRKRKPKVEIPVKKVEEETPVEVVVMAVVKLRIRQLEP